MRRLFFLLLLLGISSRDLYAQSDLQTEVKKNIFEGLEFSLFINGCQTKSLDPALQTEIKNSLKSVHLFPSRDAFVRIANDTLHLEDSNGKYLFKSESGLYTLYIEECQNLQELRERWLVIQAMQKVFWGFGYYYFKFDPLQDASLNVMFSTNKHIITIQKMLPFKGAGYDDLTNEQWKTVDKANTEIVRTLKILADAMTGETDKIYAPTNGKLYPKPLNSSERIFGFVQFWTEVKYNFAFFGHVPELNWDQVLAEYLPRFAAEQTTYEYYRLLSEVCAKLKDGHTNVYFPPDTRKEMYYPNVELRAFDNGIFVINTSKKYSDLLPLGSRIVKVDGQPVADYMEHRLFPYISASTSHIRTNIALNQLFELPIDKKLSVDYVTPKGKQVNYVFSPGPDTTSWLIENPRSASLEFEMLEKNIAYLKLNTFEDEDIVTEFFKIRDSIGHSRKLVIDLRDNTGGNSNFGYEILKCLSAKPFLTSKWATREHKAAYKAWGQGIKDQGDDPFDQECLATLRGEYWHVAAPDTIEPDYDKYLSVPVVILIGNNTASAAEDFLIAAESAGLTETVGDLTFGSTGEPLWLKMPGGGKARICSKKDTYPDGKEFVGYGIKPKYTVKPGLEDVLENRDIVLKFALNLKP